MEHCGLGRPCTRNPINVYKHHRCFWSQFCYNTCMYLHLYLLWVRFWCSGDGKVKPPSVPLISSNCFWSFSSLFWNCCNCFFKSLIYKNKGSMCNLVNTTCHPLTNVFDFFSTIFTLLIFSLNSSSRDCIFSTNVCFSCLSVTSSSLTEFISCLWAFSCCFKVPNNSSCFSSKLSCESNYM